MSVGGQVCEAITTMEARRADVWAIVVTYQPDVLFLGKMLSACSSQVAHLLIVDNGSRETLLVQLRGYCCESGCEILELGENLGVAAAQNQGVERAKQQGGTHVLLFDQDSMPSFDMVKRLLARLDNLTDCGAAVAAVGPRLVDRRTGESTPFIRIGLLGAAKKACGEDDELLIETDFLVSSGMLIPLEVIDRVGLPEEGLFIDNVDLEWCFRARSMGLVLYGVCDAVMSHSVGDQVIRIGRSVIHRHGPLRQYYIMRNRILLYRRSYSPWGWVVQDFFRMLFKFAVFSLILPPRFLNLRMMLKGIMDGLRGKTGKFD